jgi:hypothetical protein
MCGGCCEHVDMLFGRLRSYKASLYVRIIVRLHGSGPWLMGKLFEILPSTRLRLYISQRR